MRTFTSTRPVRPRTLNAERAGHHMAHRRKTAAERDEWAWLWRVAVPSRVRLARVWIEAFPYLSGPQQDTGNCYPSVKAAIDGLVDAGVIRDDGPAEVAGIVLHAPERVAPKHDRLTIRITEMPTP